MDDKTREERYRHRPTEPLPTNFRPAIYLFLFLVVVTLGIAGAAAVVDLVLYG